jgi:hypothetical protein
LATERVGRGLAAILAAGYSRLMSADQEGTPARLKALRRELADPKIKDIAAASSKLPVPRILRKGALKAFLGLYLVYSPRYPDHRNPGALVLSDRKTRISRTRSKTTHIGTRAFSNTASRFQDRPAITGSLLRPTRIPAAAASGGRF